MPPKTQRMGTKPPPMLSASFACTRIIAELARCCDASSAPPTATRERGRETPKVNCCSTCAEVNPPARMICEWSARSTSVERLRCCLQGKHVVLQWFDGTTEGDNALHACAVRLEREALACSRSDKQYEAHVLRIEALLEHWSTPIVSPEAVSYLALHAEQAAESKAPTNDNTEEVLQRCKKCGARAKFTQKQTRRCALSATVWIAHIR